MRPARLGRLPSSGLILSVEARLRMATGVAEELPGFIPRVLRFDDVSLLRTDETVFNAMVEGWLAPSSLPGCTPVVASTPILYSRAGRGQFALSNTQRYRHCELRCDTRNFVAAFAQRMRWNQAWRASSKILCCELPSDTATFIIPEQGSASGMTR